jgi:hypothetical protein
MHRNFDNKTTCLIGIFQYKGPRESTHTLMRHRVFFYDDARLTGNTVDVRDCVGVIRIREGVRRTMPQIRTNAPGTRLSTAPPSAANKLIDTLEERFMGAVQNDRLDVGQAAPDSSSGDSAPTNLPTPGPLTPPATNDLSPPEDRLAVSVPSDLIAAPSMGDGNVYSDELQALCAMCDNVSLPNGEAVSKFLSYFEGKPAQAADAEAYRLAPYAIWRDCDYIMARIKTFRAEQSHYEAFHRTCRAWNCVAHALSNNLDWLSASQRKTVLKIETILLETRDNARVSLRPHVALACSQDTVKPPSRVHDKPPIHMAIDDMPSAVQSFVTALKRGQGKVCRHLLLKGPPGSGKTVIAQNIAHHLGGIYFEPTKEFRSGTYGKSANNVEEFFKDAHAYAIKKKVPVVVFLDEIDAWMPKREYMAANDTERQTVITAFIRMLNPDEAHFSDLVVIGATNLETHIDEAILDRFGPALGIELPDRKSLERALSVELQGRGLVANQLQQLAALAVGMNLRSAVLAVRSAAHDADFVELRRTLLAYRTASASSASIAIYDRLTPGFTAQLKLRSFTAAYKNRAAYHIFSASDRTWSLEFHSKEAHRLAGIRLALLDGASIVSENLSFRMTNTCATRSFSSHLTPTTQETPQSWYLPWEGAFESLGIAPGTEPFAHLFADDSLLVRLEVPVSPRPISTTTTSGLQIFRMVLQKKKMAATGQMEAVLDHPDYRLHVQKDASGRFCVTPCKLAEGIALDVMLRLPSPSVRVYSNHITIVGQQYLLESDQLPLRLLRAYIKTRNGLQPDPAAHSTNMTQVIDLIIYSKLKD